MDAIITEYVNNSHYLVLILEPAPPQVVSRAMAANLSIAVHTSLLMLPETFTREQLYTVIVALSYQGNYMYTTRV